MNSGVATLVFWLSDIKVSTNQQDVAVVSINQPIFVGLKQHVSQSVLFDQLSVLSDQSRIQAVSGWAQLIGRKIRQKFSIFPLLEIDQ